MYRASQKKKPHLKLLLLLLHTAPPANSQHRLDKQNLTSLLLFTVKDTASGNSPSPCRAVAALSPFGRKKAAFYTVAAEDIRCTSSESAWTRQHCQIEFGRDELDSFCPLIPICHATRVCLSFLLSCFSVILICFFSSWFPYYFLLRFCRILSLLLLSSHSHTLLRQLPPFVFVYCLPTSVLFLLK